LPHAHFSGFYHIIFTGPLGIVDQGSLQCEFSTSRWVSAAYFSLHDTLINVMKLCSLNRLNSERKRKENSGVEKRNMKLLDFAQRNGSGLVGKQQRVTSSLSSQILLS